MTPAPPAAGSSLLVPPGGTEPEPTAAKPDLDMRYYKELMDTVPQESASVPLILHSMLEQVRFLGSSLFIKRGSRIVSIMVCFLDN